MGQEILSGLDMLSIENDRARKLDIQRIVDEFASALQIVVSRPRILNLGGTVAQWLALLPHSKKVLGSNPSWDPGPFCVEFACSPRVCVGFLRVSGFLPPSKDMYVRARPSL